MDESEVNCSGSSKSSSCTYGSCCCGSLDVVDYLFVCQAVSSVFVLFHLPFLGPLLIYMHQCTPQSMVSIVMI